MKNAVKILLLAWICMAATCVPKESEHCHPTIKFFNNSNIILHVNYIRKDIDVDLPNPFDISKSSYFHSGQMNIKSHEVNEDALLFYRCIEHIFDGNLEIPLYVCIFDAVVVENTPWEVVARDYLVLKRYDLTLADLQRLDWQITYPPDERMKDIKQYPPYENK